MSRDGVHKIEGAFRIPLNAKGARPSARERTWMRLPARTAITSRPEGVGIHRPQASAHTPFDESYHALWALRDPVVLTDAAKRPPVNLLARVEAQEAQEIRQEEVGRFRFTRCAPHFRERLGIGAPHSLPAMKGESDNKVSASSIMKSTRPKLWRCACHAQPSNRRST